MSRTTDPRRQLPSMDRLMARDEVIRWAERWGREPVRSALRASLSAARERVAAGVAEDVPETEALLAEARSRLERAARPSLRPVLNATGVVLHTNLGRAPLAEEALDAMREIGRGYSNLEYDLDRGERGSRHVHCTDLLCELTGAEDAVVVNNNAAAVSLVVNALSEGREVVVSRGEMVEIGGSFRIPDVVTRSGGILRGVGTTNRTRPSDYREATGDATGLILKVHPSNYRVSGFTERVPLAGLAEVGRERGVPVVHDLGSGLLRPELLPGFPPEPSPAASLEAGADLVTWSGDKLFGGPQAGVILGAGGAIERLRRNPLLRAFRVDKTILAALEATLRLYRDPDRAADRVPVLRRLREAADSVAARARDALEAARSSGRLIGPGRVEVKEMRAVVGGGSFPGHRIESAGWVVTDVSARRLDAACRAADPPLVGRIREDDYLLDFRTLEPGREERVAVVLDEALRRVAA